MLETIYLAVQKRITEHTDIRFVDLDFGQYEFDIRPAASFPSVLVDFIDLSYTDMGDNVQECTGSVILRMAVAEYSSSSSHTPEFWQKEGLKHFRQEQQLNAVLHGHDLGIDGEQGSCSALSRISSTTERRDDNLRIRVIAYAFRYEDYSTADPSEMKEITYEPKIEINHDQ